MQIKQKIYKKILLRNAGKVQEHILIVVTFKSIFYLKIH